MKKTSGRILSLALALIFVLGLFPTGAFAEGLVGGFNPIDGLADLGAFTPPI